MFIYDKKNKIRRTRCRIRTDRPTQPRTDDRPAFRGLYQLATPRTQAIASTSVLADQVWNRAFLPDCNEHNQQSTRFRNK